MNPLSPQRSFAAYGASHWTVLVLLAVGVLVLAWFGGRYRGTRTVHTVGRVLAVVLLAFHVPILIYDLSPARFDIANSLPFHISDLAWMAAAYALWTRRQWAYALTYYWGLTLAPQALITPSLATPEVASVDFVSFWGQHLLVVWAAVFLTWWVGMRPDWRGFALAAAVTVAWGLTMLGFNELAGTNYLFVSSRPDNPSVLDFMGEWPWYLGVELVIGLAVWALLTWPWTRSWTGSHAAAVTRDGPPRR